MWFVTTKAGEQFRGQTPNAVVRAMRDRKWVVRPKKASYKIEVVLRVEQMTGVEYEPSLRDGVPSLEFLRYLEKAGMIEIRVAEPLRDVQ